jgi:hypothetical protein
MVWLLAAGGPAAADPVADRAVVLFQQACLPYAGNSVGLREWAGQHHLPEFPDWITENLAMRRAAVGYNASTAAGKLALLSVDDGDCEVIADHGDAAAVEGALSEAMAGAGVTLAVWKDRSNAARGITQRIYRARAGAKSWLLSVTSSPSAADQAAGPSGPRITLLATPLGAAP